MGKKNSQIHLLIETERLGNLRTEAETNGVSLSELIRRKLSFQPTTKELELLREIGRVMRR